MQWCMLQICKRLELAYYYHSARPGSKIWFCSKFHFDGDKSYMLMFCRCPEISMWLAYSHRLQAQGFYGRPISIRQRAHCRALHIPQVDSLQYSSAHQGLRQSVACKYRAVLQFHVTTFPVLVFVRSASHASPFCWRRQCVEVTS